jgi:hypothetical protein
MCVGRRNGPGGAGTPRDLAHSHQRRNAVDTTILRTTTPAVLPDEAPHGCYEGFVYIGHIVEDENGEPVEVIERVPCRRCRAESL